MVDLLARLSSRKFLLAVGGVIALFGAKQYTEAVGVIATYVLAEAGIDATHAVREAREVIDVVERESASEVV